MSERRFNKTANSNFYNNAQSIQQPQYYGATHQQSSMPYNDYYQQQATNCNSVYARSMTGHGEPMLSVNSVNGVAAGGFAQRLNPDAQPFQPGVRYVAATNEQNQPPLHNAANAPLSNYAAHYSNYMNQPLLNQQQQHQQQQSALYAQQQLRGYPTAQYYAASSSPYSQQPTSQHHQQAQQIYGASKYPPQPIHMSQQQNAHQYMMSAAVQEQQQQQQPQMLIYTNNDSAVVPQQQQQQQQQQKDLSPVPYSQYPISAELTQSIQNCQNRKAVIEIQIGLEQLAGEPQEYELWANAIKGRVGTGLVKEDLEIIAWIIVEMSCMCPQTQYGFSRLCKLLDGQVKSFTSQYVIPRISQFVADGAANLALESLSDFVIFLAELYDKIENNGVRVSRLGKMIMDQLQTLLRHEELTDHVVKNVVQVLKLTGRHIEEDQDPVYLNAVFARLNEMQQNSRTISESVKHNVKQLNKLRSINWGVTKNDDYMNPPVSSDRGSDGICYGPDGVPLTDEERAFLEENCESIEGTYGVMEDEAQADYETFLREQAEATAIGAAEKALGSFSMDEDDATAIKKQLRSGTQ